MNIKKMELINKSAILAICGVFLLIAAVIGVTYAAFNVTTPGAINTITTGTIVFSYSEPTSALTISKAIPKTDEAGMLAGDYFDFSVATTTSANMLVTYEISGTKVSGTIDDQYIKLYLTYSDGTSVGGIFDSSAVSINNLFSNSGIRNGANDFLIFTDEINATNVSTSKSYRLRMWLDSNYQLVSGVAGTYSLKINVDAIREPLS